MNYYNQKICTLFEKLFISEGNVKDRICLCEENIINCYIASKNTNLPDSVYYFWEEFNKEYLSKIVYDSNPVKNINLYKLMSNKRNKTLVKYLHFFLEEYNRVSSL